MVALVSGVRGHSIAIMAASLALSAGAPAVLVDEVRNTPPPPRRARVVRSERRKGFVPANINSRTGKPHEHKREIARRLAQRNARFLEYMGNGGFSRRGNEVGLI